MTAPWWIVCPDCQGDKWIYFEGIHPSRSAGSHLESPDLWREVCQLCDGIGEIAERREQPREDLWGDYVRLHNELEIERAEREMED